ncbi:hypothetical protein BSPA14S_H0016 (plasmid) [Borreliella spielmanii A14S]|uniref:Uncharacterized protein n=1 Tax=Borreliella spielmanii A14S TaxID=498742 RepID=C0RCE2_9SPIR|nr:hypothetical protein BSPA14S_H0016 [Borreliella spielmanii A14S]
MNKKKHPHSMTKTESKKRLLLILHNQYNNKIVDENFSRVFVS